jgi:excisionase family DNA binding protein
MTEKLVEIPSLDSLLANPGKAATLPTETAQRLLIGLACLQPLLIQRALMGAQGGQEKDLLLTVPDVAKQLQLSSYRVYELVRQGALKSVHLGKSVRVRPAAGAEYLAQQRT